MIEFIEQIEELLKKVDSLDEDYFIAIKSISFPVDAEDTLTDIVVELDYGICQLIKKMASSWSINPIIDFHIDEDKKLILTFPYRNIHFKQKINSVKEIDSELLLNNLLGIERFLFALSELGL